MPEAPKLDESLTQKVAELARLELTPAEVTTFTRQLGDILQYVEQLQKAEAQGVEPLIHPLDLTTPLREDVVVPGPRDSEGKPKVLSTAPDLLQDGYKVPPIL